jgi:hypothetical protein
LAAVSAGQALLQEAVGDEVNPAALVGDRTTSIKITALRALWVGSHVFIKIETNHGVVGWGDL